MVTPKEVSEKDAKKLLKVQMLATKFTSQKVDKYTDQVIEILKEDNGEKSAHLQIKIAVGQAIAMAYACGYIDRMNHKDIK